jgi:Gluconate 2-dehydrogenase subunit 3
MHVNRRTAIRQFLFVSAGVTLLPSCFHDQPRSSVLLSHFTITGDQEKLLAELAGTIVPTGATPGASDTSAHLFALKMLDDCYTKEQQQKFLKGLQQLDDASLAASGHRFAEAGPAERTMLLTGIESKKGSGTELDYCYREMKRLTIQAYTSSQFFLTKVRVYELVPGRWHGCVPVKKDPNKPS